MNRSFYLVILFFYSFHLSKGQEASSKYAADIHTFDSLSRVDFNQAINLGKSLLADPDFRNDEENEEYITINIARLFTVGGMLDSMDSYLNRYLSMVDTVKERDKYADYLDLLGNKFTMIGELDKSLSIYLKAYEINKALNRKPSLFKELSNIGTVMMHLGEHENAVPYIEEAKLLASELNNKEAYASLTVNHAIALKHVGDTLAAYEMLKSIGNDIDQVNLHLRYAYHANMVDFDEFYNQIEQIKYHAEKMIEIGEKMGSQEKIGLANAAMGSYYKLKGQYDLSKKFLHKAEELYSGVQEKNRLINIYDYLRDLYFKMDDYRNAYDYQLKYQTLRDEIQDQQTKSEIFELEKKFDVQRQRALTLEKELELNKTRSQLKNRTIFMYLSSLLLLTSLGLIAFVYKNSQKKKQIQEQKMKRAEAESKIKILQERQKGEEEQREKISRDLHDNIGGLLIAAKMQNNALSNALAKSDLIKIGEKQEKVNSILSQAHTQARTISHRLAPIKLKSEGLVNALKYFIKLYDGNDGMVIYNNLDPKINDLPEHLQLFVYRSIQEFLSNAFKYAKATEIFIDAQIHDEDLIFGVRDNGIGFENDLKSEGIGLANIKDQVENLAGQIRINSQENIGSDIQIVVPLVL